MELKIQKQPVVINEIIYDAKAEQSIECDALLPDYCADIHKILRCIVTPTITSYNINGEKLVIDGSVCMQVCYLCEAKIMRSTSLKVPFCKTIELKTSPHKASVIIKPSVDYVNCRAVNHRRVDIRGALSLQITAIDQVQQEIVEDCKGLGVQVKNKTMKCTTTICPPPKQFSISEELELPYGKEDIACIIKSRGHACVSDFKVLSNKIISKGELTLDILYTCEKHMKHRLEYTLPISQILDVEGVTEESECCVDFSLCSLDISVSNDNPRTICVDAVIGANVIANIPMETNFTTDCYSTDYNQKNEFKNVNIAKYITKFNEKQLVKNTYDLPEGVKEIETMWSVISNSSVKLENHKIVISSKLITAMFATLEDGDTEYFEISSEITNEIQVKVPIHNMRFHPNLEAKNTDFSITSEKKLEVRCEVLITGVLYDIITNKVLTNIIVDKENPKQKNNNFLFVYYAASGEYIWDIAKKYNTSVQSILENNDIENEQLSNSMTLLIPIV
ncbi:MAG: DUF3794 domain-containing protein [Oscillospiraceae bacterium]